jgi:peroxiredoxin Q/BCP
MEYYSAQEVYPVKTTNLFLSLAAMCLCASQAAADMPQAGDRFPDWALPNQNGVLVSSEDLAGSSYVLWFYPKAMTPGCTAEGNAFRDRYAKFVERGVKVFGVSFDAPKQNAQFADNQRFPYPLLSDEKRILGKAVGATSSDLGYARRISFLVGPDGTVVKAYDDVSPTTHADEVLRDLDGRSAGH